MSNKSSSFQTIANGEWVIAGMGNARQKKLLGSPRFEQMVADLSGNLTLLDHGRSDMQGHYRFWAIIQSINSAVDRFFNSRSGYRAQFYYSKKNGAQANRYAVSEISKKVLALLNGNERRTCGGSWVQASLCNPNSKVWIYQGSWLRYKRLSDRNLEVGRWHSKNHRSSRAKKLTLWSRLTPSDENRLVLKGGYVTSAGRALPQACLAKTMQTRSKELFLYGFT